MAGRSGVAAWETPMTEALPATYAGVARDFTGDIENFGTLEKEQKKSIRKGLKVMCRESQMGVAAAQLAIARCRLDRRPLRSRSGGLRFRHRLHADASRGFQRSHQRLPRCRRQVRLFALGQRGNGQGAAAMAAEIPAEHAGQPRRDLQRSPRPEQFDHASRSGRKSGRRRGVSHDRPRQRGYHGRRSNRHARASDEMRPRDAVGRIGQRHRRRGPRQPSVRPQSDRHGFGRRGRRCRARGIVDRPGADRASMPKSSAPDRLRSPIATTWPAATRRSVM